MLPYTVEEIKRRVTPVARKYRLAAVYLFGSFARGEATAESDVDLLVDLTGSSVRGIVFGGLYNDLCDALGTEIDLLTVACLNQPTDRQHEQQFNESILRERKMIFRSSRSLDREGLFLSE